MSLQDLTLVADRSGEAAARSASATEIVRQAGYSRHDARIARILAISQLLGTPISISYLDSCDVRTLPVILERLERGMQRRAPRRPFEDWRAFARAWWQRPGARG